MLEGNSRSLNICMISYRSNPHCGGQGVYVRNLSKALKDLGHNVDVVAGPPDPLLNDGVNLKMLQTLDLYNPDDMFRIPTFKEFCDPINVAEWLGVSTMGYPEPFTFGLRAYQYLRDKFDKYDVIHDNQSLSYGIWALNKFVPTVATIHHPITIDRKIAVKNAGSVWRKMQQFRWYSFIGMQKRVSRRLPKIITVSECSKNDIKKEFKIPDNKFKIVPNGINTDLFHPMPKIRREANRIIVTNSADMALKGLSHLLYAVASIAKKRKIRLTVIGAPKKNGMVEKLVRNLDLRHIITFTGRVDDDEFIKHYAKASIAVVPSVYEGFGLPVGEAMACGIPVICTTGGALPEVAGDAAYLVPPANSNALADAIVTLLDNPEMATKLGEAGYKRITESFTWKRAAEKTVDAYREAISDYC